MMMCYLAISLPFTIGLGGAGALVLASFVSIISIANPFSGMPVFTSLTVHNTNEERIALARKAAIYMFCILLVFLVAGTYIISFFGISLAGIRVAGGFIIARSAWNMLSPQDDDAKLSDEHKEAAKAKDDISFSPLAMPLLAGPGSIAVVIGLASEAKTFTHYVAIAIAILFCAVASYFIFRLGPLASKYIGESGMNVVTRLMGFIVMAIAVQFILSGIRQFFAG
jgi:multiple antibiotic resistance protein